MASKRQVKRRAIEERRMQVAGLALSHVTYREMADTLNVSLGTIASDIRAIRQMWRDDAVRSIASWVEQELATLAQDERTLREMFAAQSNHEVKLRIYDRIFRIRERRAQMLGLDAQAYQIMLVKHINQDAADANEEVILAVGGTEDDFVSALRQAQGLPPGRVIDL